jgi:iron complex transport system ATP-binding protein
MTTALDEALADAATVGPFFTVTRNPPGPGLRPLTSLYGEALQAMITEVTERLGTEPRVAASLLYQGIASRLWSPALATAAIHGVVPDLNPAYTYWQPTSPGPILLTVPPATTVAGDATDHLRTQTSREVTDRHETAGDPPAAVGHHREAEPAAAVRHAVVEGNLRPLAAAVRAVVPVAAGLLWGNAASALAGALAVLAQARPRHAAEARRVVDELLATPPLRDTGEFGPQGFRRRSCCLYYRVPGGGLCGDCALL